MKGWMKLNSGIRMKPNQDFLLVIFQMSDAHACSEHAARTDFSSPLGRFYCFSQWTPFWGAAGRTGSCRLALEPQKQGAKQEPLWLVQLILVDSSACSDNEATQAAVWCGQDRREHGWSVSLVGQGVGVWEPAPCPHSPGCPVSPAGRLRRRWAHPLLRGWAIQGRSRFSRTSES